MVPRSLRGLFVGLVLVVCCAVATPATRAEDPLVAHLASQVTQDNVTSIIQTLEGFGTRYSFTPECDAAAEWIHSQMESFGIEVTFEQFDVSGYTLRNVIGRIEGSVYPERVIIIGAHYDSTSETPWVHAPGADDNASGVAAVLEAARIFSAHPFEHTIEFIAFGGEEQGRRGSKHNATQAALAGKNIMGIINLDMIGYWPPTSDLELDIGKNAASSWLAALSEDAALTYASIPVHNWPDTGVCYDDHVSYWEHGYAGVVLMDCYEAHLNPGGSGESTPYYHTTDDTIETLDLAQTTEAVRAAVAATALVGKPIVTSVALSVGKMVETSDVQITWNGGIPPYTVEACTEKDFSGDVLELTPPGGTTSNEWVHPGVLDDGVDYYYRVTGL